MIKIINSVLACVLMCTAVNAAEFEVIWKQDFLPKSSLASDDVMKDIQQHIAYEINSYLKPRKAIDVSGAIPKEIDKPSLPPKVSKPQRIEKVALKQGKYERKSAFKKRVDEANTQYIKKSQIQKEAYLLKIAQRNAEIQKLSNHYKSEVRARNAKILELQALVSKDIEAIKDEQKDKKRKLDSYIQIFVKNAFKLYLGAPHISSSNYTVDNEIMQIEVDAVHNNYPQKVEFVVDPHIAKQMDENLDKFRPMFYYKVNSDMKNSSLNIALDHITLGFEGENYLTKRSDKAYTQKYMLANIEIDDPTNVSIADQKLDLQEESLSIVLQKSTLKDVTYRVTTRSNNEITQRLKTLKETKSDEKKWLFAIGIEQYDNEVAPIAYSAQSTKSYALLAQKLLGVPQENSFVLINQKASSGRIKSEFRRLLSLVKKGDTIYFYYSGHGIPVASQNNEPYMLPYDIDPSFIDEESFYKLKNIYAKLSDSKASKIIAVVDSCFSGSTDGESILKGVAAARLVAKKVDSFDYKKMVVLSAGGGKQYSNMYKDKEQRLFSYFVMNSILENEKNINDLYKDVHYNVEKISRKMGNLKLQQPTINGNASLSF